MGIDHNKRLKEHLYYYSARISRDISNLIKWLGCCHYRMYRRSCQHTVFFYVKGSDQLPEGS